MLQSGDFFLHYFKKQWTVHNQPFTVTLWSAVHAVCVLFILSLEFSERKTSRFLSDVHIVAPLNEPVDNWVVILKSATFFASVFRTEWFNCSSGWQRHTIWVFYFLLRIYDKTYQNTNKQVCYIHSRLRRTDKLKPHSMYQTWTGVRMHEMYLFFALIIYMCLVMKSKLKRLLVNK